MADLLLLEPGTEKGQQMLTVLTKAGHHCTLCTSVAEGLEILRKGLRMATVLNARLPWTESAPFLRALESSGLPVLFLTADKANMDHLRAMYRSDCDVLLTDATDEELVAAVAHLLTTAPSVLVRGDLSLDMDTHQVTVRGREEALTEQEFSLLRVLMLSSRETVSRDDLLRIAWGYQSLGITRTVDVHVQRLRRKLGSHYIETIYKLGYRLNPV